MSKQGPLTNWYIGDMFDTVLENPTSLVLTRGAEESHSILPLLQCAKVTQRPQEPELEQLSTQGRSGLVGYACST